MDSVYSSITSEYLKPLIIELPLQKGDEESFSIKNIPHERTDQTINQIINIQDSFPFTVVPFMIYYFVLGMLYAYISVILIVISLFNMMLFIMLLGIAWKYINWTI